MPVRTCTFRWIALSLAAFVLLSLANASAAAEIKRADVTKKLGPSFFIDEAAPGGKDVTGQETIKLMKRADFSSINALNVGAGGTEITITGIGWASPNQAEVIDAEALELKILYLGEDGKGGNNDDIEVGSIKAELNFTGAGEYAWVFDEPMTVVIDGKNSFFRIEIAPRNSAGEGTIRIKADENGAKFSVAGTSKAVN